MSKFIVVISAILVLDLAGIALIPIRYAAQQRAPSARASQISQEEAAHHRSHDKEMALIPRTIMQMGIDTSEIPRFQKLFDVEGTELFSPEIPRHTVILDAFYIDRYLVTNADFKKFIGARPFWSRDRIPPHLHNGNYLRHWETTGLPSKLINNPVVNVSWYAAVAYCQWVGKRLPTEAEWEHAARGSSNRLFPWGDKPVDNKRANYRGSVVGTTTAVGSYPANEYGLFDMVGNVWEFMADEWRYYPSNTQTNPIAGGDLFSENDVFLRIKSRRVIRGGSWGGDPINLWIEYRDSHPPEGAKAFVGFRCAKSDLRNQSSCRQCNRNKNASLVNFR